MRSRKTILSIAFALFVITLTLYWPTRHYEFVNFDDNDYVTENAFVAGGLKTANIAWAFTHVHEGYWIPVTWISYMTDCELWGLKPGPPHLVNAAIHSLNAILLFLILYLTTGAVWRSALVAAFFAWHPLYVESVAWIAERKNVLSTLFWLLGILAYVRFTKSGKRMLYLGAVALFIAGLMAKPTVVTFPITLLLLDVWPLRRTTSTSWARLVAEKAPFLIISGIFCGLTIFTQNRAGAVSNLAQIPLLFRAANAVTSYGRYLLKTAWPVDLIAFYPLAKSIPFWSTVVAFVFLVLVTAGTLLQSKTRPHLIVGWIWFLVTMAPAVGVLQSGAQSMADRFTYVPLIGIFIAVGWGLGDLVDKSQWARLPASSVSVAALLLCLYFSSAQIRQWKDPFTLFSRVLAVAGPVPLAHNHLGSALFAKGEIDAAIEHFRTALAADPNYADSHNNLGTALCRKGQRDEGIAHFREALRLNPNNARFYNNYGNALVENGMYAQAIKYYEEALTRRGGDWAAHNNRGVALLKMGRKAEARAEFREALRLKPEFEPARKNLAEYERNDR